ncbi:hypothetical protein IQ235_16080 [Oscillatoriales cyanobacterium LEGE 11467]|uniref:Uncharacterized protein n=1 Tax=Zarconia navalis LEGE 11467 TaxID=1828826 RepID=A0A928VY24_9CYAN|nr:hypothetical protein [Zarconia navalis]MBE9042297.1 hypothetical protein [Zarconia navalis LEGE 11467]
MRSRVRLDVLSHGGLPRGHDPSDRGGVGVEEKSQKFSQIVVWIKVMRANQLTLGLKDEAQNGN